MRLETVPVDRRREAPPLRLEWTPTPVGAVASSPVESKDADPKRDAETDLGALRDEAFAALAAASRAAATRGETPAFLIRVPFLRDGPRGRLASVPRRANDATARVARAPPPHADGPILLVRPAFCAREKEGDGGARFVVEALASLPSLLLRAVRVAGASAQLERGARAAAAHRTAKLLEARDADDGGTEKPATATPASVASTGRKRARAGDKTRAGEKARAAAAAAAKRRSSERRRDASAVEPRGNDTHVGATVATEAPDLDDGVSRERALARLATSRVRTLSVAAKRRRTVDDDDDADADDDAADAADAADDDAADDAHPPSVKDADAPLTPGSFHRAAHVLGVPRCRRPIGASAFACVLSALAAAQRRRDGGSAETRERPPPFSPNAEEWAPEKLRLTATLLRAAADVAAGLDVVGEARRDAAGFLDPEGPRGPASASPSEGAPRGSPSRSPSKSGASRERAPWTSRDAAEAPPGGDVALLAPGALGGLDYAAAEAELRAKVQRERREKRERQRIAMAPRRVAAARRTGGAVLAAAAAASADRDDGGQPLSKSLSRGGAPRARDRARGSGNGTSSGHDGGDARGGREERGALRAGLEPEPSESAVGAGAAGPRAPRTRACTKCHIELAPIPGVDMSLMKHCYACGGTLAPVM